MFSRRNIPNQLTTLRAVLAIVFFVVLNQYAFGRGPDGAILVALAVFIVASITDWLDGYLARRWNAISAFGRIMDPFCDKLLVLGALLYLAGPRFVDPDAASLPGLPLLPAPAVISGVAIWMVVLMLARELLVTGIRGEMESRGVKFGAKLSGKLKTALQMIIVPLLLVIVWVNPHREGWGWLAIARDALVWATVAATVASGWPYVVAGLREAGGGGAPSEHRD